MSDSPSLSTPPRELLLFPVPAVPAEALRDTRLAYTAAREAGRQIERALTCGTDWQEGSAAEMGRLLVASKFIAEALGRLLKDSAEGGGK